MSDRTALTNGSTSGGELEGMMGTSDWGSSPTDGGSTTPGGGAADALSGAGGRGATAATATGICALVGEPASVRTTRRPRDRTTGSSPTETTGGPAGSVVAEADGEWPE